MPLGGRAFLACTIGFGLGFGVALVLAFGFGFGEAERFFAGWDGPRRDAVGPGRLGERLPAAGREVREEAIRPLFAEYVRDPALKRPVRGPLGLAQDLHLRLEFHAVALMDEPPTS